MVFWLIFAIFEITQTLVMLNQNSKHLENKVNSEHFTTITRAFTEVVVFFGTTKYTVV